MLNRLLELLQTGDTHRVSDLARRLGTTPQLVEMMLEELQRMGRLKPVGERCVEECKACPLAGACAAGMRGRAWTWEEEA